MTAITGGLALQMRHLRDAGRVPNDIDLLVPSFDSLPSSLAHDFLFRHIHPHAVDGKMLVQMIDPVERLRIDIFRECGSTIARSTWMTVGSMSARVVSLEDLAARTARLVLDLAQGVPIPRKHAQDFLHLNEAVAPHAAEQAWSEHRKPGSPATFEAARRLALSLIAAHPDLLIQPAYSQDVQASCERCQETDCFRLCDPAAMLELLGYC